MKDFRTVNGCAKILSGPSLQNLTTCVMLTLCFLAAWCFVGKTDSVDRCHSNRCRGSTLDWYLASRWLCSVIHGVSKDHKLLLASSHTDISVCRPKRWRKTPAKHRY